MNRRSRSNYVLFTANARLWVKLITAALAFTFAAVAASPAESADRDKPPFPVISIPGHVHNEAAIRALGDRLPEVAAWYGKTAEELARLLRHDRTLWVDKTGRLLYECEMEEPLQAGADAASGKTLVATASFPLDQTFRLHSSPSSSKVIYLDFQGHVVSGTVWNDSYNGGKDILAAPFSLDSDPTTFNSTELQMIQNIWKRVAEDYSPFDVDVTTEEPAPDALIRSSNSDTRYGVRVLITPTTIVSGYGGYSYIGVFDDTSEYYKTSWVFSSALANGEKYIAEACSHESGHSLGLHHEGTTSGTVYYQGQGSWAPIMGNSYYRNVTQWAKGEYADANNREDQLQVMQNNGLSYYTDDHGNTAATATVLPPGGTFSSSGFIERNTDVDVFRFLSGAGAVSINVTPAPLGPDLNVLAELRDSNWNLIASSNLPNLGASISLAVPAGAYYLAVSGIGSGDPVSTGFSSYASLGQYVISGTVPDPTALKPPVASASASPTSGNAPLAVYFSSAGSADNGTIVAYSWDFGDGSAKSSEPSPSHTYMSAGSFTATLTVTDNDGLTAAASVIVSVRKDAFVDSISFSSQSSSSTASAIAAALVKDVAGNPIAGATVSGAWSGVVQGTSSGATNAGGTASLSSPQSSVSGTFTFTVSGVSAPGYTYNPVLNRQTSGSITVTLLPPPPPSVSITAPAANSTLSGTALVQVSAGSALGIASVSLSIDGSLLATDTVSPYTFSWDTRPYANGTHTVTATAKDKNGITAASSQTYLVDNVPDTIAPTIVIVSPQAGATVSGNLQIRVSTGDNVGVAKVELYVDGRLTATSTSAPFTTKWNTNRAAKGLHNLMCKAHDAAGNVGSAAVQVYR